MDCEYNRRGEKNKKLISEYPSKPSPSVSEEEARTVFPDIVVHHRTIKSNLLVIEIKKSSSHDDGEADKKKLRCFLMDKNYRYQYGLFLRLGNSGCTEAKLLLINGNSEQPDEVDWCEDIRNA